MPLNLALFVLDFLEGLFVVQVTAQPGVVSGREHPFLAWAEHGVENATLKGHHHIFVPLVLDSGWESLRNLES